MLVKNNATNTDSVKTEAIQKKKSKFWLLLVLGIFFVLIFLPLWFLLRSGLFYLPVLSSWVFKPAVATYEVEKSVVNEYTLMNNFTLDEDNWYVSINEKQLSFLLDNYLGEGWQIIVDEGRFELYGPLMSAVNNEEQKSFVKVVYNEEDATKVELNDLKLPQFISNYLINKYLLDGDTEGDYFKELRLEEEKIILVGEKETWQTALSNIDYNALMQELITYFIKD